MFRMRYAKVVEAEKSILVYIGGTLVKEGSEGMRDEPNYSFGRE